MPPSSVPSENTEELSPLTDQNVEILHLIITTAQFLPQAERFPYRTLFEAYDTILLQNGLDPDHDQVYFRFLLRLGGIHGDGTLYEKFEILLDQMGIRLEFDGEGDGTQEVTRHHGGSVLGKDESQGKVDVPRGRPRRASFGSLYDAGDESTQRNGRRTRSQSSMSRPPTSFSTMRNEIISTRATTRTTERNLSHDDTESLKERPAPRGRLTSQDFGRNLQHYRKRGRSTSSPGDPQIWPRTGSSDSLVGQQPPSVPEFEQQSHMTEEVIVATDPSEGDTQAGHRVPPELLFRPPGAQMAQDAEKLYHQHLGNLAVRVLRQWRNMAMQLHYHCRDLDVISMNHDRATLLHQAFDTWRVALQDKRQKAETERFFAHIERRAKKARDLYLVTKAFTHWAQSASDEAERTSVARRHILRSKCFNAWRDITAVNELKVRRQILKKFYAKWKRKYTGAVSAESKAAAVYGKNLARKMYWAWLWNHKGKRASELSSRWVKKRYLTVLIADTLGKRERDLWVESVRKRELLGKLLGEWSLKAQALSRLRGEARNFRDMSLKRLGILCWERQAELVPVARQVVFNVEWRISRDTFIAWLRRTKASKQATKVDRLRVLRNAWTSWNDQLRLQTLAARIDERIVLQALYRWVLAERYTLLKRLFEKRQKQATLRKLVRVLETQRTRIQQSERTLRRNREGNLVSSVFCRWCLRMGLNRQREQLALGFLAPRILQDTVRTWTSELEHFRLLERWALDAEFYFLTTKAIRFWQKALADSKRQKRKTAYAQTRRMAKINLASWTFALWRGRALQVTALGRQAEAIDENRVVRIATDQIGMWRDQLRRASKMALEANMTYNTSVTKRNLRIWSGNLGWCREMNEKAEYYAQVRILESAATLLRKWRMRVLGNRGRDMNAQLFKERSDRMHFRNIFRHWQNRTAQQRGRRPTNSSADRHHDADLEGNGTKGAEDWTAFDDRFDFGDWIPGLEASSSTPIPAYLSTPSKRAARAKAMVKMVTTPGVRKTPLERKIFPAERGWGGELGKSIRGKGRDLDEGGELGASQ